MESLSATRFIAATQSAFPVRYSTNPIHITRFGSHIRRLRLVLYSQKWDFQDFQGYAKPVRLLPATQIEAWQDTSLEKVLSSLRTGSSKSVYKVQLQTSKIYGSGLTDMNSGVLLCLIDENGQSILQRIPASLSKDTSLQRENRVGSDDLHFQQGSTDEFIFEGPVLGKVASVWIGVESGQWRVAGLKLVIIGQHHSPSSPNEETYMQYMGFQYNFEIEDVLLGEGTDVSMMELRPSSISQLFEDIAIYLNGNSPQSSLLDTPSTSKEASMKEYADLKFSLLLYDAILILVGSSLSSFLAGENTADAFFVGGLGGFLYLLLLQRTIDGLPVSEFLSRRSTGNPDPFVGKLKGPIASLVLAFAIAVIAAKYASGASGRVLTPQEIMSGMMGFLMCKVAVVLAAFKPMPLKKIGDS